MTTQAQTSHPAEDGYVPDKETAVKIDEYLWLPVYGKHIYKHRPFVATLKGGVWTVEGTLHSSKGGYRILRFKSRIVRC